ncbi:MAG: hypothetical protein D6732_18930 [Methanobacteriota archaeon]|nr:MAG: hypothetical protein D6732_18930 [Euryarchaeota archaeon]
MRETLLNVASLQDAVGSFVSQPHDFIMGWVVASLRDAFPYRRRRRRTTQAGIKSRYPNAPHQSPSTPTGLHNVVCGEHHPMLHPYTLPLVWVVFQSHDFIPGWVVASLRDAFRF